MVKGAIRLTLQNPESEVNHICFWPSQDCNCSNHAACIAFENRSSTYKNSIVTFASFWTSVLWKIQGTPPAWIWSNRSSSLTSICLHFSRMETGGSDVLVPAFNLNVYRIDVWRCFKEARWHNGQTCQSSHVCSMFILLLVQKSNNHLKKKTVKKWNKLPSSTGEFTGFLNHQ